MTDLKQNLYPILDTDSKSKILSCFGNLPQVRLLSKQGGTFGPLMRSLPRDWAPEEAANLESVIITALPSEFERQSPCYPDCKSSKKYWHQPSK